MDYIALHVFLLVRPALLTFLVFRASPTITSSKIKLSASISVHLLLTLSKHPTVTYNVYHVQLPVSNATTAILAEPAIRAHFCPICKAQLARLPVQMDTTLLTTLLLVNGVDGDV